MRVLYSETRKLVQIGEKIMIKCSVCEKEIDKEWPFDESIPPMCNDEACTEIWSERMNEDWRKMIRESEEK